MTLMLVTDCRRAVADARTERDVVIGGLRWLAQAVEAGIDVIQIREHGLAAAAVRELTTGVVALSRGTRTRVVVNDRADVAVVAQADGVHLRDDGWPAERVRALSGRAWTLGRSVHDLGRLPGAVAGADYAVFGAVYGSAGKPPRGLAALASVAAAITQPVIAVGGITVNNAGACRVAGAAGVAAIALFLPPSCAPEALGPIEAIRRLRGIDGFSCTVTD